MLRAWTTRLRANWHALRTVFVSCAYLALAGAVLFVWEANVDQFSKVSLPTIEPNKIETAVVSGELAFTVIDGATIAAWQRPDLPAQIVRGHVHKIEGARYRFDARLVTADGQGTIVVTNASRLAPFYWLDVTQPIAAIYDRATDLGRRALIRFDEKAQSLVETLSAPSAVSDAFAIVDFRTSKPITSSDFSVAVKELRAGAIRVGIEGLEPAGSRVVLVENRGLYEGKAVRPSAGQNLLTQVNTGNQPASFTLTFSEPLSAVTFTVPAVRSDTASGITFPAWKAVALSANSAELSSTALGLLRRFGDEPAKSFTLTAPGFDGIAAVRFESNPNLDGRPFAAFSGILIEELKLKRAAVDCTKVKRLPACQ
jgi:hypothetical protein